MNEENRKLNKRKEELKKAIDITKGDKKNIIGIVQKLLSQLNSRAIDRKEYNEKLAEALGNRSPEQWTKYYDDYLDYYNYQLNLCDKLMKEKGSKKLKSGIKTGLKVLMIFAILGIFISLFFILKPAVFDISQKGIEKLSELNFKKIGELSQKSPGKISITPAIEMSEEEIKSLNFPVIVTKNPENIANMDLEQGAAVIGEPVKWDFKIDLENPDSFSVNLPEDSEVINVEKIQNGQQKEITSEIELKSQKSSLFGKEKTTLNIPQDSENYAIEYETSAPEIREEKISNGKRVVVKGPDKIHYRNILTYSNLPKELDPSDVSKIKIYQIKNIEGNLIREPVVFSAIDSDEDGLLDSVEWVTPSLSEAIFEIIIEISKAQHLDSDKNFISDIYENVKAKDGNWSEKIYDGEYVRVTFAKSLDNTKDITVYPRNSENKRTIIEVYLPDSNNKIAEFPVIENQEKYQIFLKGLFGSSEVFDLKIKNLDNDKSSYLEFDYIVDPPYMIYNCSDLQNMNNNPAASYVLMKDIDCSGIANFKPVGSVSSPFTGTFDGNGYEISNLKIYNSSANCVYSGLFSVIGSGIVRNLGIIDPNISGGQFTGAVAGYSEGIISNVFVSGSKGYVEINANNQYRRYLGGLVGYLYYGRMNNSYNSVKVNASSYVGGLVGYSEGGEFYNSYSSGYVYGDSHVGCVAGYVETASMLYSSYGSCSYVSNTGYGFGEFKPSGVITSNNLYCSHSIYNLGALCKNADSPVTITDVGSDLSQFYYSGSQVYTSGIFTWDYNKVWKEIVPGCTGGSLPPGCTYPRLRFFENVSSNYIASCRILDQANTTYYLQNNVESFGTCFNITADNVTLNCQGYTINYSISGIDNQYGITSDKDFTSVKNCKIIDGNFSSSSYNGGGISLRRDASSCISSNLINNWINVSYRTGLLAGCSNSSIINNTIYSTGMAGSRSAVNLFSSRYNLFENNTLFSRYGSGLVLSFADNSTIRNNYGYSYNDSGLLLTTSSDYNNIVNNYFESKNYYGMYIRIGKNNLTSNTAVSNSSYGIYLEYEPYNYLVNNTGISNYSDGIHIFYGEQSYLRDNRGISRFGGRGILLDNSNNLSLINNNGTSPAGSGIMISASSNNNLISNTGVSNSGTGIHLTASSNNTLTSNNGTSTTSSGFMVSSSSNNNLFTSNTGTSNSGTGVYLGSSSSNNTLSSNKGTSNSGYGIYLSFFSNNTLISNTGTSNSLYGILIVSSLDNNLTSNIGTSNSSIGIYGMDIYNLFFNNNTGISNYSYGIFLWLARNTRFANNTGLSLLNSSANYSYVVDSDFNNLYNIQTKGKNVFLNCSYNLPIEIVQSGTLLIRQWYYRAYVNDTSGLAVSGANISAFNRTNGIEFLNLRTNQTGWTNLGAITDYANNGGTRTFYSNYLLNATNGSLKDQHSYNATLIQNNLKDVFTLKQGGIGGVDSCMILSQANTQYNMTGNIINPDMTGLSACINITAQNITLDCKGYYLQSDQNKTGVYSNQYNTTIKNCNISMGSGGNSNALGIEFVTGANNGLIFNNTLKCDSGRGISMTSNKSRIIYNSVNNTNGQGIYLSSSSENILINNIGISKQLTGIYVGIFSNNNLLINNTGISASGNGLVVSFSLNNTLISNTGITGSGYGIYLSSSSNNTLISSTATCNSNIALYLYSSSNNNFYNPKVIGYSTGGYAIYLGAGSDNNTFQDCTNLSGVDSDVLLTGTSRNNTLINCSYRMSGYETAYSGSQLIRDWYYRAYVNDSSGFAVSGANISAFNKTNGIEFLNLRTNSSGWTNITTITDYVNNGGARNFYSNYTLNATNGSLKDSHPYNVALIQNNLKDVFTLHTEDTTPPSYTNLTTNPTLPLTTNSSSKNISVNFIPSEYPVNLTFTLYNSAGSLISTQGPYVINSPTNLPKNFTIPGGLADGNYTLNMTLTDLAGNRNETTLGKIIILTAINPRVILSRVYPLTDVNVSQNKFFNVTFNVSCLSGNCGTINVSLDPNQIYSEYFIGESTPSFQCTNWNTFKTNLGGKNYSQIVMNGSNSPSGISCNDPAIATNICQALYNDAPGIWTCDGNTWRTGICGPGLELTTTSSICGCATGYTVRPCIGNNNWGGINGITCSALSQTMSVSCISASSSFSKGLISNIIGATPFYTTTINPFVTNPLNAGQSQIITFLVNATGNLGNYTFFGYANLTSNLGISNITSNWNVQIVSGMNLGPKIYYVQSISPVNVEPEGSRIININFSVYDENGYGDINSSSAKMNVIRGSITRQNLSCFMISGNGNYANYSCNISMRFFDNPGDWNISIFIKDNSGILGINDSTNFYYIPLQAWDIRPNSVNWSNVLLGSLNQKSDNNLTIINQGNVNITTLTINASNLQGQTFPSDIIPAGNFRAGKNSCNGTDLVLDQKVSFAFDVNYTESTEINPVSKDLGFCLKNLTGVRVQIYLSTRNWGVDAIFAFGAVVFRAKKRRRANSFRDNKFIYKINEEKGFTQKTDFEKNKILDLVDKKIKERFGISLNELISSEKEIKESRSRSIEIPISIFKEESGPAEILCTYLHENLNLKFSEISRLINRDQRTIWMNYHNCTKKKIIADETSFKIPITLFSDRRFSILESLVKHMKEKGLRNKEIAQLLNQDQRVIGTLYSRINKKIKK